MVKELKQELQILKETRKEYDILKVWGKLLVDLRENNESMIMGVLELIKDYKMSGDKVVIICHDKVVYDALSKDINKEIIDKYLAESGVLGYEVQLVDKKKDLSIIEVLKSKFDNIIIEE